jgi:transcriptional regulator with XRE-family HTH domain
MDQLGATITRRAAQLGLTQQALAEKVGVHVRQIRRYERNEQQPVLSVAAKLAQALELTLDELAGTPQDPLDGTWWTARQVEVDGRAFTITVDVEVKSNRQVIDVQGRGWHGELKRGDTALTGWYEDDHGQQGTMFFLLRDEVAVGRWVGASAHGAIVSGHAALARTREAAQGVITGLTS